MPGMSPTPFLMGLGHKSKTPVDDASSVSPTSNTEMAAMYERYKQMIQHDIDRNDFIAVCRMVAGPQLLHVLTRLATACTP
jgi:hypothetical protein